MSVPRSEDILAVAQENVAAFIRDQASTRRLTPIIRSLNQDLLDGDMASRDMAARALAHLGFVEHA